MNQEEWPGVVGDLYAEAERNRIVRFLWAVYESSTHGASGLMERAIRAVEANNMDEPIRVAAPVVTSIIAPPPTKTVLEDTKIIRKVVKDEIDRGLREWFEPQT